MKKSLFLFAFLLLQLPFLQAQLSDDFSDGDFTNSPTWSGDVGEFQISTGNELQSNGPSGSATLHLSTPNTQFSNTKWEFLVKLDGFNPSTSNYAQVYLMSDASDLEGSLNGYVVRVGRTSDRIQLSKLTGTGFSTLVETADSYLVGNNTNVRIQVTRDALGNWSLKTDLAGGTNFTEIGTAFDDTFTNTSHFGVLVRHSSTRRNLFFFDDFLIELIPTIPTISLSGATASNSNQVLVIFSDTVDLATAETEANYSINNGIGAPTLAEVVGFNQVRLTLASSLSANNYELTANNVENKAKTATIPANSKASFAFTPPEINLVSASQFGQNGVRITFSDTVDLTTAETEANYFVNNGIGVPILAESTAFNQVLLTFTDASIKTGNYNLTVNNVQNKSKTATVSANSIASFDFVGVIGFRELVINEIFADPSPTIDLPDAEFVEIHNPTTSSINLKDATFSDASSSAIFPDYELASNSYLILCARSDTNSFKPFGATLGLSGFPSAISNSGELLQLKDAFGNVIDEVDFELSWYRDAVKNDGGYSLEIINPTNDSCFWGMQNWIASTDASGGTPGKINSVFDNTPDTQSPEITQVVTQSLDTIFVEFNEKLTNSTLVSANISISNGSETILVNQVVPLTPITFYLLIQPLTAGKLYELVFSNVEDCTGNPIGTNSSQIGLGRTPTFGELVISEIMADPEPQVGLPEVKYVEIHNTTSDLISMKDVAYSDNTKSALLPNQNIASGEYILLSSTSASVISALQPFGKVIGVSSFPEPNTTGDDLSLRNPNGELLHSVFYDDDWYRDDDKNDGGYSLEIINPTNDSCFWGMQNWIASTDASGGTPGKINSVFDNTPDTQSPEITQVVTQSLDTIFVEFNEKLTNSTLVSANISISNGSETILVNQVVPLTPITFYLLIQPLTAGKLYELVFSNVEDCTGNPIGTNSSQIGLGRTPTFGELVISEIMADPEPQVGLPEVKYVEIHNTTSDLISMKDVAYSDNTKSALLPNQNIASGEYILLSSTSASVISALQPFGKVIGVSSFPEPNTTGDDLSLRNPNGELLHSVFYDDDWYRDDDKNDGGYSLEMIDTSLPCLGFENWTASDDNSGGTPGSQNSVFGNQPTDSNFEVTRVSLISPSSVTVTFNRNLSDTQLTTSNISIISGSETISVSQITQSSPNSFRLTTQPLSPDKAYEIAISSLTDCAGNTLEGNSTIIGIGRTPDFGDLIMSEIFADPTPQVGLPDGEFVELHNTTSFGLELSGVVLSDGGGSVNLPSYFLPANSYVILCNSADEQAFSQFGKTIPVSISLNVSGEQLILQNPSGEFLHRADFNTSWYRSDLKADGGYSLEIIDPNFPCKEAENWNGSANARGGTPGESSSVSGTLSDEMPPKISTAFAENSNTIILVFDEFLDAISATESNNFSIDNGVSVSQATFDLSNPNRVKLTVSPSLEIGTIYEVTSVDLEDCSGNFQSTSATVQVSPPDVADIGDLILNEVTPQAFSGGVRFVEIYNNSDKFINLQGWKIQKDTTFDSDILSEGILIIPPKTHFAFTENKFEILSDYTNAVMENVFEIAGIPAFGYNEDNGKISLINHLGVKFDSFRIREEYQFDLLRDTKGVSLERISFDAPTNEGDNWKSASSTSGFGTPGYLNSQNIDNPKNNVGDDCFSVFPEVFSPDNDGNRDFTTISYTCNQPNSTATIRIYDALGRLVKTLLQNRTISTEGFFQWDGTTDENEKARVGYYIVLIETFELGGGSNVVKKTVAIGGF
jgi:hypothetical protein